MEFLPKSKKVDEKKVAENATRRQLAAIKAGGIPTKEEPGLEEMDFEQVLTDLVPGGEMMSMAIPSQGVKKAVKEGVTGLKNLEHGAEELYKLGEISHKKVKPIIDKMKEVVRANKEYLDTMYDMKALKKASDYNKIPQQELEDMVSFVAEKAAKERGNQSFDPANADDILRFLSSPVKVKVAD